MASGKFKMVTTEAEFTRLESELSFLQVRLTKTLQETIRQVKAEICEDRKQIVHTRLESIAGAEWERTPGHPQRRNSVRDEVSGSGGAVEDSHQLHQRNTGDSQRDECIRRSDQLRDQSSGGAGEVQRCRTPEVEAEWAMVLPSGEHCFR